MRLRGTLFTDVLWPDFGTEELKRLSNGLRAEKEDLGISLMLKRIITGTGIFAVLIGMFASRIFWTTEITTLEGGDLTAGVVLFDAVLALMAIVGTFEVVRAMDVKMLFIEKIIALIFPIIVFPIATFCGATYALS